MFGRRALFLGALTTTLGTAAAGCATPQPALRAVPAAILADNRSRMVPPLGVSLPDEPVVRVVGPDSSCSGTLISDNEVLTAHHCIVQRDREGRALEADLPARSLEVELGGDYLPWGTVKVRALVAPPCGYNAGHGDIAILILSRHLKGIRTMVPRLSHTAFLGEEIDPVGFGHCASSVDGVHRIRRSGGSVEQIGSSMLFATTSMCPGDSGGPARSRSNGEVVGIVSAGVMDGNDQTVDPSLYTRLDVWRSVFANAKLIARGASPSEVPPLDGCDASFDFSTAPASTPPPVEAPPPYVP